MGTSPLQGNKKRSLVKLFLVEERGPAKFSPHHSDAVYIYRKVASSTKYILSMLMGKCYLRQKFQTGIGEKN